MLLCCPTLSRPMQHTSAATLHHAVPCGTGQRGALVAELDSRRRLGTASLNSPSPRCAGGDCCVGDAVRCRDAALAPSSSSPSAQGAA